MQQEVFPTNQELNKMLGTEKYNVWADVCNLVENLYEIDILRKNTNWNNWKYEHKYRRGGKTLCTLYAKENCLNIQIVFGKDERVKFENEQHTYSDEIQSIYKKILIKRRLSQTKHLNNHIITLIRSFYKLRTKCLYYNA